MQNPIAYDTVEALDQIFEPIDDIFNQHFADSEKTSEAARFYYEHYFRDLFALYRSHRDGLIKGTISKTMRLPVKLPLTSPGK